METLRFYPDILPDVGALVVAKIGAIHEVAVDCTLPAYGNVSVLLPTSEIPVRKHKRVTDYIRPDQLLVVHVVRVLNGQVDVSLKQIRAEEGAAVLAQFHRDAKVHLIVRTAADLDDAATFELYKTVIWPLAETDILGQFEEVRSGGGGGSEDAICAITREPIVAGDEVMLSCHHRFGAAAIKMWFDATPEKMTCPVCRKQPLPQSLVRAIYSKLPERTFTAVKEIQLKFTIGGKTVTDLNNALRRLATMEQIQVFVTAPPLYRLVATDKTQARAEARLQAALDGL